MKWSAIAIPIVLLIDILVLINFTNYRQAEFDALKQREYDIMVNYACDAAMQEAMEQAMNTSVDYRDVYAINLDPEYALYTYTECILRALGWSVTEENRDIILQEYTPYFIVVESDGFYTYSGIQDTFDYVTGVGDVITSNIKPNEWSVKLPFSEYDDRYIYIYSMEDNYYVKYDKTTGNYNDHEPYIAGTGKGTLDSRDRIVASRLNTIINQAVARAGGGSLRLVANLPVKDTVYVKAATRPSIYTMFVDKNVLTGEPIVAVAGTQASVGMTYICYTRGSNKYYTYAYNRDIVEKPVAEGGFGCVVEEIYTSQNKAAMNGYYPDILLR